MGVKTGEESGLLNTRPGPAAAFPVWFCLLFTGCGGKPASTGSPASFSVISAVARHSGDHVHVTITVKVKNSGTATLTLAPPAAQLWIGKEPVPPFIAPGTGPAVISPATESEADTHWWLENPATTAALELEINGTRQPVSL
ncbi:MAG TPA: hypothetical protein VHM91_11885, partial [Verrucomicrobiales bacterium]|nr:hypothetical protein [Verrucomicrobiales bacterium]